MYVHTYTDIFVKEIIYTYIFKNKEKKCIIKIVKLFVQDIFLIIMQLNLQWQHILL